MALLQPFSPKPRYIPKRRKLEESVRARVCSYLRNHYPGVVFFADFAADLKLTPHQSVQLRKSRSSRGIPDLTILCPRKVDGRQYAGLCLELKQDGTVLYKKDGTMRKNTVSRKVVTARGIRLVKYDHNLSQARMLEELTRVGYKAEFAVGFDEAARIIDEYMGQTSIELF
jgi:hypothetical protein